MLKILFSATSFYSISDGRIYYLIVLIHENVLVYKYFTSHLNNNIFTFFHIVYINYK